MSVSWCETHGLVNVSPPGPCPIGGEETRTLMRVALALCTKCGLASASQKFCSICGAPTKKGMGMTGQLSFSNKVFKLNGVRLARCSAGDPISAGTAFVRNNGFDDGDNVTVTGSSGSVGDLPVFCMTSISAAVALAAASLPMIAAAKTVARRAAPKKAAASPAQAEKKAAKKQSTSKSVSKPASKPTSKRS